METSLRRNAAVISPLMDRVGRAVAKTHKKSCKVRAVKFAGLGVLSGRKGAKRVGAGDSQLTIILLRRAASAGLLAIGAWLLFTPPATAAAKLTIESGGASRSAFVVLRDRLKLRRRPLIIVLRSGGGLRQRRHHGLEEVAESSKPIFVYPEAEGGSWPTAPGPAADRELQFL